MIALALALAAVAPAPVSLLGPGDLRSAEVLPPPPPANTPQAQAERTELETTERSRSPADLARAKEDSATKDASIFSGAIGRGFRLDRFPETGRLMLMVRGTEKSAADQAKAYFKRPRPWIGNPAIQACSRDDDPLSSYPSGHATMAFSMGAILARLLPDRAPQIMARAARYGESRLVCEVHFRSDVTAGEALGLVVAERLMSKPAFVRQFRLARAELGRGGIVHGGIGH
jgi:acid phosphatase (class A)